MQCGTEAHRKHTPSGGQAADVLIRYRLSSQHAFEKSVIADGNIFFIFRRDLRSLKTHAGTAELTLQFLHDQRRIHAILIHLVDEQKNRDLIIIQQLPECLHLTGYSVRCADHENSRIEHHQRSLHLRRKIHMAGRIKQRQTHVAICQLCLSREDCNAALLLHVVRIQKGISVIHTALLPDSPRYIQHALRKRCFSRVHMCKYSCNQMFFHHSVLLPACYFIFYQCINRWFMNNIIQLLFSLCQPLSHMETSSLHVFCSSGNV